MSTSSIQVPLSGAPTAERVSRLHFYPFAVPQPGFGSEREAGKTASAGRRRLITRQQGEALEKLGHAADYLIDSYIALGPVNELLVFGSPQMEAVGILIESRRQLLFSIPLAKPMWQRLLEWLTLRRPSPVIGLSMK